MFCGTRIDIKGSTVVEGELDLTRGDLKVVGTTEFEEISADNLTATGNVTTPGNVQASEVITTGDASVGQDLSVGGFTTSDGVMYLRKDEELGGPVKSTYGSLGSRLVYYKGTSSAVPYGVGVNSAELYTTVPALAKHTLRCGTDTKLTVDNGGAEVNGDLTVSGNLYAGNLDIPKKIAKVGFTPGGYYFNDQYVIWNRTHINEGMALEYDAGGGIFGIKVPEDGYYLIIVNMRFREGSDYSYIFTINGSLSGMVAIGSGYHKALQTDNVSKVCVNSFSANEVVSVYASNWARLDQYSDFQVIKVF
jgi:hypothetical protein